MRARIVVALLSIVSLTSAACSKNSAGAARELFETGNRYVEQKKYAEAIVTYRKAVQLDPQFGEARSRLADAYDKTGDAINASREYVRAADLLPDNAEAQLKAGVFLLAAGKYDDARTRALKVAQKDPKNVNAQLMLAMATAGLRDLDGAVERVEEAIKIDSTGQSYSTLGELRLAKGRVEEAEAAFKQAVNVAPNSTDANLTLGQYQALRGRLKEAEQWFVKAAALAPNDVRVNRALAAYYIAARRPAEAEKPLKAYVENAPDPAAVLVLADYYFTTNRSADARALLEARLNDKAVFGQVRLRLAAMAFVDGHRDLAHRLVDEVLAQNAKDPAALVTKGRFLLNEGQVAAALTPIKSAVAIDPKSTDAHFWLGAVYRAQNNLADASQEFVQTQELNPRHVNAALQLAQLSLLQGKPKAAVAFTDQALAASPGNVLAHLIAVDALLADGNVRMAESGATRILSRLEKLPEAHVALGKVKMAKKDRQGARRSFERAAQLGPDSFDALAGLVQLDIAEGRAAHARAAVEARLAKQPKDVQLLLLAQRTYAALKEYAQAEHVLRTVLEVEPSNIGAREQLARVFVSENKLDDARREYDAIATADPKNIDAHTQLAVILQVQGHREEAVQRYEKILEINPNASTASNNLALLYAEDGKNLDVALQLAQAAKRQSPNSPTFSDTLGWIYFKKGLESLAIPSFEQSVGKEPTNPVFHYHLGLAYAKAGQKARARASLEQSLRLKKEFDGADDARKLLATL